MKKFSNYYFIFVSIIFVGLVIYELLSPSITITSKTSEFNHSYKNTTLIVGKDIKQGLYDLSKLNGVVSHNILEYKSDHVMVPLINGDTVIIDGNVTIKNYQFDDNGININKSGYYFISDLVKSDYSKTIYSEGCIFNVADFSSPFYIFKDKTIQITSLNEYEINQIFRDEIIYIDNNNKCDINIKEAK